MRSNAYPAGSIRQMPKDPLVHRVPSVPVPPGRACHQRYAECLESGTSPTAPRKARTPRVQELPQRQPRTSGLISCVDLLDSGDHTPMEIPMSNRALARAATVILCSTWAMPPAAQQAQQPSDLTQYVKATYSKREVMIPMRDGVKLFTSIYVPKDASPRRNTRSCSIARRTPSRRTAHDAYRDYLGPSSLFAYRGLHLRLPGRARPMDVRRRVRQHAAAHRPARRARRTSTRAPTPTTRSTGWSRTCPTTTAGSGMWGISYPGFYTVGRHDRRAPGAQGRLAAGAGRRLVRRRRLAPQRRVLPAARLQLLSRPSASRAPGRASPTRSRSEHGTPDGYKFFLEMGTAHERAEKYRQKLGNGIPFWNEMAEHPNYDDFWKAANPGRI